MQGRLLAFKKVRKRPKCHLGGNKRPADFFYSRKIALTIDTTSPVWMLVSSVRVFSCELVFGAITLRVRFPLSVD